MMDKVCILFKLIKKYTYIYLLFVKNCIIAEMEYRANFVMGLIGECSWLVSKLLYAIVFYKTGNSVFGFNPDQLLVFVGMHTLMTGVLVSLFFPNFYRLSSYIKQGSLDLLITKPISLQFMVTLRYFGFGALIPNFIGGLMMIIIGMYRGGLSWTAPNILFFLLYLLIGTVVTYCIFLLPSLLSFKIVEMGPVNMIVGQMQEMNNIPMVVYSKWIQNTGIYVIPLFLISNIFPMLLFHRISESVLLWSILSPLLLLAVVRWLWTLAVKSYASASS